MKMKFVAKGSLLAVLFLAVVLSPVAPRPRRWIGTVASGITPTRRPSTNWARRTGNPASATARQYPNGFSNPVVPAAMPNNGMNNGFGVGQNINVGLDDRYLQLTFDTNGVLTAWSKNY